MKTLLAVAATAVLSSTLSGCAMFGKDDSAVEFDKDTGAADTQMLEDKARTNLGTIEAALADYVKEKGAVPEKLDQLIPKYLAAIPPLDVPACGRETERVQNYPPEVLRDGQVDGARLLGTGRWGYVYDQTRVVVFVDCLKTSGKGVPWYQERGVF